MKLPDIDRIDASLTVLADLYNRLDERIKQLEQTYKEIESWKKE